MKCPPRGILEVNVKDSMKLFLRIEIGLKEVTARIKARFYFEPAPYFTSY
jgi:hypothetical protein